MQKQLQEEEEEEEEEEERKGHHLRLRATQGTRLRSESNSAAEYFSTS